MHAHASFFSPKRDVCSWFYSTLTTYLCSNWDKCTQSHFSDLKTEMLAFVQLHEITELKRKPKDISARPLILQMKHPGIKISHSQVARQRLLGLWEGKVTDIKVLFFLKLPAVATPWSPGRLASCLLFFRLGHSSVKGIQHYPIILCPCPVMCWRSCFINRHFQIATEWMCCCGHCSRMAFHCHTFSVLMNCAFKIMKSSICEVWVSFVGLWSHHKGQKPKCAVVWLSSQSFIPWKMNTWTEPVKNLFITWSFSWLPELKFKQLLHQATFLDLSSFYLTNNYSHMIHTEMEFW